VNSIGRIGAPPDVVEHVSKVAGVLVGGVAGALGDGLGAHGPIAFEPGGCHLATQSGGFLRCNFSPNGHALQSAGAGRQAPCLRGGGKDGHGQQ